MKIYLSGFFFLLSISLSAQKEVSAPFFFNEFSLSVNQAMPADEAMESRIGWGIGLSRVFWPERNANLVVGLAYNRINLFAQEVVSSRWHRRMDVKSRLNYLFVPVLFRYGFGNKIRPFAEAGPNLAIGLPSSSTGMEMTSSPLGNDSSERAFDDKGAPNTYLGLSGGLGIAIQIREMLLLPKINYQLHTNVFGDSAVQNIHFVQFSLAAQL